LTTEQNRLQELDADLTRQKQLMDNYEAAATDGALPPEIYDQYKSDLRRYNNMVEEYNSALETQKGNYSTYQEALAAFKDSVAKYNGTP
jgi:multidrug resistance efflux pump